MHKVNKWIRRRFWSFKKETKQQSQCTCTTSSSKRKDKRPSVEKKCLKEDQQSPANEVSNLGVEPEAAPSISARTATQINPNDTVNTSADATAGHGTEAQLEKPAYVPPNSEKAQNEEELAAIKIQTAYRGHLARKALQALKRLVKVQALVRGHLVRKRASEAIKCMQSLLSIQAQARAQRLAYGLHPIHGRFNERDESELDGKWKNVEMDTGTATNNSRPPCVTNSARRKQVRKNDGAETVPDFSAISAEAYYHYVHHLQRERQKQKQMLRQRQTHLRDLNADEVSSMWEEESVVSTARNSPRHRSGRGNKHSAPYLDDQFRDCHYYYNQVPYPNYMANTECSKARVRSQSAPRMRTNPISSSHTNTSSRRRMGTLPDGARMLRSSSQVPSVRKGFQNYQDSSYFLVTDEDYDSVSLMGMRV